MRRALEPLLVGRRFDRVRILDERLTRPEIPDRIAGTLHGERVSAVGRRGKYLVMAFASGRHLLVHLRMSGSFRLGVNGPHDPYRRAVIILDDGLEVVYRDVRRFGTWAVFGTGALEPYLRAKLGPEPLGPRFTTRCLERSLAGRRGPIKALLLDQRVVAGVGNIYADEALWRARIDPRRRAPDITRPEISRIVRETRRVLRRAIALQGSSLGRGLGNFADLEGGYGSMQEEFDVYGRAGLPCRRCGTTIRRTVVGGRGTSFCPRCQQG